MGVHLLSPPLTSYPGAEPLDTPFDGPGVCAAKYTTSDGLDKVANWYRDKLESGSGREGVAINPANQPGIRIGVVDDSRRRAAKQGEVGDARPAPVVLLLRKSNEVVVTVAVSRDDGDKLTHVALVVVDNKAK